MFMFSLVHLGTTRNYIAVEEKFSGFVLVSIGKSVKGGHCTRAEQECCIMTLENNRKLPKHKISQNAKSFVWAYCNGVTASVTPLVTLIVCILGVVILEHAMLYQNVGINGREQ